MDAARTTPQLIEDIRAFEEEGLRMAPILRSVAGLTWGTATARADFIAAAVACGYKEATAGVCWAAGRKFMQALEKE
jgi:hypothetical protein